jgi:hypothetical protein
MEASKVLVIWVDGSTSFEILNGIKEMDQFMGPTVSIEHDEGLFMYGKNAKKDMPINFAATEILTELGHSVGSIYGNVILAGPVIGDCMSDVDRVFAEDIVELLEMRTGVTK